MAQNMLSNLAKRNVALSGQATMGDVPYLYALRAAQRGTGQADLGGTPGLASGTGGTTPLDSGGGGGGAVGGQADIGLPGESLFTPELERDYVRLLRGYEGKDAPDRGEIASRGQANIDVADPFGVEFGQSLSQATQVAQLLGVPYSGMANAFVDLMLKDAQAKSDAYFDALIEGTAPVDPTSGITIARRSGPSSAEPGFRGDFSPEGGYGVEATASGYLRDSDPLGLDYGGGGGLGGDAGSGGGGGGGSAPGSAGGAPGGAQGQGQ